MGTLRVTISATTAGAPAAKTATFELTVTSPPGDFTMALTSTPSAAVVNQSVTWNGTVTAVNGYSGSVALSCTGTLPGDLLGRAEYSDSDGGWDDIYGDDGQRDGGNF